MLNNALVVNDLEQIGVKEQLLVMLVEGGLLNERCNHYKDKTHI